MKVLPVELVGEKVKLIPLSSDDVDALYIIGKDPSIWSYMSTHVRTYVDMEKLVRQALETQKNGSQLPFVVAEQDTGKVAGSTRYLDISSKDRHLEIGWTWYAPEVWRTGVNTETKYLLLKHAFETLKAIRVQFKTHHLNVRSQTAIERLGATKEGILRNHMIMYDGSVRHSVYYSIIDSEWNWIKERFETKLLRKNEVE